MIAMFEFKVNSFVLAESFILIKILLGCIVYLLSTHLCLLILISEPKVYTQTPPCFIHYFLLPKSSILVCLTYKDKLL